LDVNQLKVIMEAKEAKEPTKNSKAFELDELKFKA
jgi:hypothetical protein